MMLLLLLLLLFAYLQIIQRPVPLALIETVELCLFCFSVDFSLLDNVSRFPRRNKVLETCNLNLLFNNLDHKHKTKLKKDKSHTEV